MPNRIILSQVTPSNLNALQTQIKTVSTNFQNEFDVL